MARRRTGGRARHARSRAGCGTAESPAARTSWNRIEAERMPVWLCTDEMQVRAAAQNRSRRPGRASRRGDLLSGARATPSRSRCAYSAICRRREHADVVKRARRPAGRRARSAREVVRPPSPCLRAPRRPAFRCRRRNRWAVLIRRVGVAPAPPQPCSASVPARKAVRSSSGRRARHATSHARSASPGRRAGDAVELRRSGVRRGEQVPMPGVRRARLQVEAPAQPALSCRPRSRRGPPVTDRMASRTQAGSARRRACRHRGATRRRASEAVAAQARDAEHHRDERGLRSSIAGSARQRRIEQAWTMSRRGRRPPRPCRRASGRTARRRNRSMP